MVVAKALGIPNEILRVQVVTEEALARLVVVQQGLAVEAAALAAGHWVEQAEAAADESTVMKVADSTVVAAAVLSVEEREQAGEVVFVAEHQDVADKVAPT